MPEGILPAVPYSWIWPALGAVALLAVAAWWIYLLVASRREPEPAQSQPTEPQQTPEPVGDPFLSARAAADSQVVAIAGRLQSGQLSAKAASHELAAVVRDFASTRLGRDVRALTLAELSRDDNARPAALLIDRLYHPEFARTDASIDASPGAASGISAAAPAGSAAPVASVVPGQHGATAEVLSASAQIRQAVQRW